MSFDQLAETLRAVSPALAVGRRVQIYRNLHHGKQRQQEQTHNCDDRQCASLCAAFPAQKCRNSCQYTFPCFRSLSQEYT